MTDKEFKRLRRSDLIEILYEYQKREKALNEEIAALKAELESRDLKIRNAGSIAEAVVKLNELFETAQRTADEYVEQVRRNAEREIKETAERAPEPAEQNAGSRQRRMRRYPQNRMQGNPHRMQRHPQFRSRRPLRKPVYKGTGYGR